MALPPAIATLAEDDLVVAIKAITFGSPPVKLFDTAAVRPWEGEEGDNVQLSAEAMLSEKLQRACRVYYTGDSIIPLAADDKERRPKFAVVCVVQGFVKGNSRRGDVSGRVGTNLIRDLIFNACDRRRPSVVANDRCIDEYNVTQIDLIHHSRNVAVVLFEVEGKELPYQAP